MLNLFSLITTGGCSFGLGASSQGFLSQERHCGTWNKSNLILLPGLCDSLMSWLMTHQNWRVSTLSSSGIAHDRVWVSSGLCIVGSCLLGRIMRVLLLSVWKPLYCSVGRASFFTRVCSRLFSDDKFCEYFTSGFCEFLQEWWSASVLCLQWRERPCIPEECYMKLLFKSLSLHVYHLSAVTFPHSRKRITFRVGCPRKSTECKGGCETGRWAGSSVVMTGWGQ